jgi:hypothetical protein
MDFNETEHVFYLIRRLRIFILEQFSHFIKIINFNDHLQLVFRFLTFYSGTLKFTSEKIWLRPKGLARDIWSAAIKNPPQSGRSP